jgi:SAM-dependent methyltransferase
MPQRSLRAVLSRIREVPGTLRRVRALRSYVHQPNGKIREYVGRLYIRGEGIEIGALHSALPLPDGATARFVDRMSVEELRAQYPELAASSLTTPDIVDDGERLATIGDGTQDFVIANHFLEHCENPIGAIENMFRVLKPGGVVYLAIPDKRFTFDGGRDVTSIQHLRQDHDADSAASRLEHFRDWARHVEGASPDDVDRVATTLMVKNYSIHYHVWTQVELLELIVVLRRDYRLPFDVELFMTNETECVVVLRKAHATLLSETAIEQAPPKRTSDHRDHEFQRDTGIDE